MGRVYLDGESSYLVAVFDRHDPDARSADLVERDYESARLASAAPEMARVLLAIEWSGMEWNRSGGSTRCPSCRSQAVTARRHAPNCALDAAIRKAGVR